MKSDDDDASDNANIIIRIMYIIPAPNPIQKPNFTNLAAFCEYSLDWVMLPSRNVLSTLAALTIPMIPRGTQQNIVANMASVNHVLGGRCVSVKLLLIESPSLLS